MSSPSSADRAGTSIESNAACSLISNRGSPSTNSTSATPVGSGRRAIQVVSMPTAPQVANRSAAAVVAADGGDQPDGNAKLNEVPADIHRGAADEIPIAAAIHNDLAEAERARRPVPHGAHPRSDAPRRCLSGRTAESATRGADAPGLGPAPAARILARYWNLSAPHSSEDCTALSGLDLLRAMCPWVSRIVAWAVSWYRQSTLQRTVRE